MKETANLESIILSVRKFIFENYLFGFDENEFDNDSSFLEFGILDSFGILELVNFVEKEFEVEVRDDEILPENLDSVTCVSYFIIKKLARRSEI